MIAAHLDLTGEKKAELIEVAFVGQLTLQQLSDALASVRAKLSACSGPIHLVFDCSRMTGYDREARQAFVNWHRDSAARIDRIAIVTANPLWHLVVSAMALATGKHMKPFADKHAAKNWLVQTRPD